MNFCSDVYHGIVFFGGYPSEEEFQELLANGVELFIDLTTLRERNALPFSYRDRVPCGKKYINYPIVDNQVPKEVDQFLSVIQTVMDHIVHSRTKVYVHCKGGHGRAGIFVSSLLCLLQNIPPSDAIHWTTLSHSKRPNLKTKWKNTPCPQKYTQQKFVYDLFTRYTSIDQISKSRMAPTPLTRLSFDASGSA